MQIQVFTLPIIPDASQLEELNHFLRSQKIIDVRKELATLDENSVWTFCITYMQGSSTAAPVNGAKNAKVDYKEVLDEETFKTFSSLRKARKLIADDEAVPAYAIFTDAELAEIAKLSDISAGTLQSIPGIGKKKVEKYADKLTTKLKELKNEEAGVSY